MPDDDFSTIAIIGLGLIGGSLGLALHAAQPDVAIVGWDRSPEICATACERGAIDQIARTIDRAVHEADLVIVATPVLAVREIFKAIEPHLKAGAVVTDVSSTKAQIAAWADAILPRNVAFIGGHPMAGSEKHGIASARADLFGGAVYCLSPRDGTPLAAVAALERLIAGIGARPLQIEPVAHDLYVAAVSHLPFVLAAALVKHVSTDQQWNSMRKLAATGFRDTTRLASGDVRMHRDICLSNASALKPQLRGIARLLDQICDHLDDPEYLQHLFEHAKQERDAWLRQQGA